MPYSIGGTGGNAVVWSQWNANYATANQLGTATQLSMGGNLTAGTGEQAMVWQNWNVIYECQVVTTAASVQVGRVDSNEIAAARDAERKAAESRAEELLLLMLTDEQKKQYREYGYFETVVDDRRFRIEKGRAGNVYELESGTKRRKYCCHPADYIPDADTMLAQKLMIEHELDRFQRTANITLL